MQERRGIVSAEQYDAKREADAIIEEAKRDAEQIRKQAAAEGRERGLAAVTELLVGARVVADRARTGAQKELRGLAVRIAEKILGREIADNPDAVVDVARTAMAHVGAPREILLRVNSTDLAALERGRPRLIERCRSAGTITFRIDESVERGGCILETELGVVDARIAVQLDAIERALKAEPT